MGNRIENSRVEVDMVKNYGTIEYERCESGEMVMVTTRWGVKTETPAIEGDYPTGFSHIWRSGPELSKPEPVDLARFAAELIKRFPLPEGQSIELDPGNGQALVMIDSAHLASILENLLNNSVQSQVQKGVDVPIRIALAGDRSWVRLAVHDSGTGLDRYQLAHAFDPFFSAKPDGSGLGLSLARTLARNAGGDLELQGHGNQGCSAILVLPAGRPS